jgi:predicted nucleotidyltransferase
MNITIEEKYLNTILKILKENLDNPNSRVYVFGSRAKGTTKKYADLDLAIDYNKQKLPFKTLAKLCAAFKDSFLPYKVDVDVVNLNDISKEFKSSIEDNLVKLV